MGNLGKRVIVAVIGVPVAGALLYAGDLALALFLAALAALGAHELFRMARAGGVDPLDAIGVPIAAAIPIAAHLVRLGVVDRPVAAAAVVLVALMGVSVWGRSPQEHPLESVSVTVFGALYCGGTLTFGYALRHHPWVVGAAAGTALVLYPLVVTWMTDIGAYFVGRSIGGRRLMPTVSPGKTVSGAIGGLLVGVMAGMAYNEWALRHFAQMALSPWSAALFAIAASIAAQVGDLTESLFKREAGVKDSSKLLPGHGGVLDRLDSIYFVLPVAYLILGRLLLPAPR